MEQNALNDMKKAIIFGCGDIGIKVKKRLENEGYQIIAFADNDFSKWGKSIEGIEIINPKRIMEEDADIVAIGIYKAANIIKEQLLSYGLPESRIVIPIKPNCIFLNPNEEQVENIEMLEQADYNSLLTLWYKGLSINIHDEVFLQKVESLKRVLAQNRIPRTKVCIVSGAVLQALGLRESKLFDDIDIIMTSDLREVYGKGLVIISENAEMHPQNEYEVSDDDIIKNSDNHFVFQDMKFMDPHILYSHGKKHQINEYSILEKIL